LVQHAAEYAYSSAAAHCGGRNDALISGGLEKAGVVANWTDWLLTDDVRELDMIRQRTRTGRPCGDSDFVARLEGLIGRALTRKKPGPKPKTASTPGLLYAESLQGKANG
jgi:putative transposase